MSSPFIRVVTKMPSTTERIPGSFEEELILRSIAERLWRQKLKLTTSLAKKAKSKERASSVASSSVIFISRSAKSPDRFDCRDESDFGQKPSIVKESETKKDTEASGSTDENKPNEIKVSEVPLKESIPGPAAATTAEPLHPVVEVIVMDGPGVTVDHEGRKATKRFVLFKANVSQFADSK